MNYVVKKGDTLYIIATQFHTTVAELLKLNPQIKDPNVLIPGQVIQIPNTPTPPPPSGCPVLRKGSSGTSVVELQKALKSAGYDPGALDGVFGPKTEAAVIAFQKSKMLYPDGIVGRMTWTALGVICPPIPPSNVCPTLHPGDTGPAVKKLQELLLSNCFDPGKIDGIFGSKTETAVVNFQKAKKLVPDGIVGVNTWTALGVQCKP